MNGMPSELRARLAADYHPARPLPSPWMRALWLLPFAALALVAAPAVFAVRRDLDGVGWFGLWGASLMQVALGLALAAAALRDAVPGRGWSRASLALWLTLPFAIVVVVTLSSFEAGHIALRQRWWTIGAMCLAGSFASSLPLVALASVLAARAFLTRPAVTGALLGLGAGLMADAGWRLFCHFSEPAHVLSAHMGAVLMSMLIGSWLASAICRAQRKS
jgi:hypothetical protein